MRFFDEMNTANGEVCPLCKTGEQGQVLLVPIRGTEKPIGETQQVVQCQQVHRRCAEQLAYCYVDAIRDESQQKKAALLEPEEAKPAEGEPHGFF